MSRYLHLELSHITLEELPSALEFFKIPHEIAHAGELLTLEGSLECVGDPVQIRLPSGSCNTVEDYGFVLVEGKLHLICGEYDRRLLQDTLIHPLSQHIMLKRAQKLATKNGMHIEDTLEIDGTRRIRLTPKT